MADSHIGASRTTRGAAPANLGRWLAAVIAVIIVVAIAAFYAMSGSTQYQAPAGPSAVPGSGAPGSAAPQMTSAPHYP